MVEQTIGDVAGRDQDFARHGSHSPAHLPQGGTMKLTRCKWCIARTGKPTWINGHGQVVALTVEPPEHTVSDTICLTCFNLLKETFTPKMEAA